VLGAGASLYSGAKARKQAGKAQASNEALARQQQQRSEEQFNRQNQKQPDIAAMFQRNVRSAGKGLGSTFLTGTKGVASMSSMLGGMPSVLGG
jgi:hypothetical protein